MQRQQQHLWFFSAGEDPDTVVRVVEVVENEDGSVSVVIVVEESRADAVLDVVSKTDDGVLRRVRQWFIEDDTSLGSHNAPSFLPFVAVVFFLFCLA